jgi:hypothetical protein
VRSDEEKQTAERERHSRDDPPGPAKLELWHLGRGEPDAGKENEQEPDLGEAQARVPREGNDEIHANILLRRHLGVQGRTGRTLSD